MKLTPLERYAAYVVMHTEDIVIGEGLCDHFHILFNVCNNEIPLYNGTWPDAWSHILELLPELQAKKPKELWGDEGDGTDYWFEPNEWGNAKRMILLEECILEMEQKLFK